MSDTANVALFFAGVFLLTGALVVGVGALEYEVTSLGTTAAVPEDAKSFVAYDALSSRDKRTVDRALAGERLVFRDPTDLPGPRTTRGKLAVERDGDIHLVSRRVFFNWRTPYGVAALALALVGIASVSESVRRNHFPHRPVYWFGR
ncbi:MULTISPECIES: hypothetical protein [Halorussus]|uniref:hypothetical protein n=1 Tax=Halorussus TaxID=1070314 RepID=UPI000E216BC8|nr:MULTISPECIES: hypothetical protein [Halorussus]NHN58001.1 hypothetical protein [Halorussus sp. JP-T4]